MKTDKHLEKKKEQKLERYEEIVQVFFFKIVKIKYSYKVLGK